MLKRVFILFICIFFLSSCGIEKSARLTKATVGFISLKNDKNHFVLVIEGENQSGSNGQPEAGEYTYDKKTKIVTDKGKKLTESDLSVGQLVTVWTTDTAEPASYPTVGEAEKLVIQTNPQPKNITISRTEAVKQAIKETGLLIVRDAIQNNNQWEIHLDKFPQLDTPTVVYIDGKTGKIIRKENL